MSLQENRALVRRFVEEVQCQHNLAALDELFSPDFVDHSGMTDPPTLAGSRQFFSMMFAAFPDMRFAIRQQIAEGDKVLTHKTLQGTQLGPFMGIPATGKAVAVDVMDIFTVAGGKITEHWTVGDMLSMMRQLGVVPGP
ncbi:MAG TPA: ester cyclase [Anaerolineae bacterium]|nr:ester cyclase [Anaerolineae bacterium]